ncbi:MAG: Uma2 family endonuclease [Ruminococcaceae bacterium]|nr:Uma2 family endonuclease [Oscillospiraceae bacterium]
MRFQLLYIFPVISATLFQQYFLKMYVLKRRACIKSVLRKMRKRDIIKGLITSVSTRLRGVISKPPPQKEQHTYRDLLNLPEGERYELYDGQLVALASPSIAHQRISRQLLTQFSRFLEGKPCEIFAAPLDIRLNEQAGDSPDDVNTVVQPDLMVVCDASQVDNGSSI